MIDNPMIRMQEMADFANEQYADWVDRNETELIIEYYEQCDFEDLPESYTIEIKTDDVDEWEAAMERWGQTLTIDDVPNKWLSQRYDDMEGRDL